MPPAASYLGIEIGGTKLQLGIGAGDGTLAALWRGHADASGGAVAIRRQIEAAVPAVLERGGLKPDQIAGTGIGFGGPVDDRTRRVLKSHQVAGWDDFPLADWAAEKFGRPAALGNDADVAGLAEALFGVGRGVSPVFYVTIGSGVGGGLVIDGMIYRGGGRGAAEVGHLRVGTTGTPEAGLPLEHWVSGWSIARRAQEAVQQSRFADSALASVPAGRLTAREVAQAAQAGDSLAQSILAEAWGYLARGLCEVIALFAPRRIVIGGGVSLMGQELLFDPLRRLVAREVFPPFAGSYEIVQAALGEESVVHGALALARQRGQGLP